MQSPGVYGGQQFGNYTLHHLLGEGGFARVYLAKHQYLGTNAAIKVLSVQKDQSLRDLILDEARMSSRLDHPFINRVLEFGFSNGIPYLVSSYAPGGSLRQKHPRGSVLSLERAVLYARQIAQALQYAHDRNIVHRDVKPENLLFGPHGEVLLCDFGIAVIASQSQTLTEQERAGTAIYMAPEQAMGKAQSASDQYALAILVYEWITGAPPFRGDSSVEIALQHQMKKPPALLYRYANVDHIRLKEIEEVILKALAKNPASRFTSVMGFVHELDTICREGEADFGTTVAFYKGHSNYVDALSWSPNGQMLASASEDGTVQVWLALTGSCSMTYLGHSALVTSLAWSPNGKQIVTGSQDKTVQIWDVSTGTTLLTLAHSGEVNNVAWSPDEKRIASSSTDKSVRIWNATTGKLLITYQGHNDGKEDNFALRALAWSPDGKCIASGGDDRVIQLWYADTGQPLLTYRGHKDGYPSIEVAQWSPDGSNLASAGGDHTVQVWNARTGKTLHTYLGHETGVMCLAWSPNGEYIASGGMDGTVQICMATSGRHLYTYSTHTDSVYALAWSPHMWNNGWHIASGDGEGLIYVWLAA